MQERAAIHGDKPSARTLLERSSRVLLCFAYSRIPMFAQRGRALYLCMGGGRLTFTQAATGEPALKLGETSTNYLWNDRHDMENS